MMTTAWSVDRHAAVAQRLRAVYPLRAAAVLSPPDRRASVDVPSSRRSDRRPDRRPHLPLQHRSMWLHSAHTGRSISPLAGRSAANEPHAAAAVDRRDRRTSDQTVKDLAPCGSTLLTRVVTYSSDHATKRSKIFTSPPIRERGGVL